MRPSIIKNNHRYFLLDELGTFEEGRGRRFSIEGKEIAAFLVNGGVLAFEGECPHEATSLADGYLENNDTIVCPRHGWKFKLATGEPCYPASCPITIYETTIENDAAWVRVRGEKE